MKFQSILLPIALLNKTNGFTVHDLGLRRYKASFVGGTKITRLGACSSDPEESALSFTTRRNAIATLLQAPLLVSVPAFAFGDEKVEITKENILR